MKIQNAVHAFVNRLRLIIDSDVLNVHNYVVAQIAQSCMNIVLPFSHFVFCLYMT